MERGPNLKIKGTGSHLPLATICVILGKSPNLFRLKALICEINIFGTLRNEVQLENDTNL